MHRFRIREEMRNSIEEGLRRVASLLIDSDASKDEETLEVFRRSASALIDEIVDGHAAKLFGSPAFGEREPPGERDRIKADLKEMADLIGEDARRLIVGHTRHSGGNVRDIIGSNINSPNSTAQGAGRDLSTVATTIDRVAVLDRLQELHKMIEASSLATEHQRALRSATDVVVAEVDTANPDRGAIRTAIEWLKSKSDKAADAAITALVGTVTRMLLPPGAPPASS